MADDTVMVPRLPGKTGIDFPCTDVGGALVLIDDNPQCSGFPFLGCGVGAIIRIRGGCGSRRVVY